MFVNLAVYHNLYSFLFLSSRHMHSFHRANFLRLVKKNELFCNYIVMRVVPLIGQYFLCAGLLFRANKLG